MIKFSIRTTDDCEKLMALFKDEGIKFSDREIADTEIVKCWTVTFGEKESLVGGAILGKRKGEYVVHGIAMTENLQNMRLGHEIAMKLIEEVLILKGAAIYAAAKNPAFFKTVGFDIIEEKDAPDIFDCIGREAPEADSDYKILRLMLQ